MRKYCHETSVVSRVSRQAPAVGAHLRPRPLPAGIATPRALPLALPHNPHPQPRRASRRRIRHSPGIKQPSGLTQPLLGSLRLHRRQGRPIELAELMPLGEQQNRIRTTNSSKRIRSRLPHPLAL